MIKKIKIIIILTFIILFRVQATGIKENSTKSILPDSIDVVHYTINLNVTDFTNKVISGNTILRIKSKVNNLSVIKIDLLRLNVDSVFINGTLISGFSYNDTLLSIPCTSSLQSGDSCDVRVCYHGKPTTDLSSYGGGFYFSSGYAYNIGVAFKDYPHCYGRSWFPCRDNFYDRATYDFYITVNKPNSAVCGGLFAGKTDNGNNTETCHWIMKNDIPTYLASVAVGIYTVLRDTFDGINGKIPVELWVYPNDSANASQSFRNLGEYFSIYENKFGPYKWERVGYVETPFANGAMEHATNINFPSNQIDGTLSGEAFIAHELSHHWFGNLVTCTTDKDMWLNEGWARFCEFIYKDSLYGRITCKDYIRTIHKENLRYLHIRDSGYRAVWGIPPEYTYSSTVYNKGAIVTHSLRGYLGDSLFFGSVKNYLSSYSFNNASSDDLKNSLSAFSGIDLTDFFNFWVYSPGYTQFTVDSFRTSLIQGDFYTTVFIKQKQKGVGYGCNSSRVEITFMDSSWRQETVLMEFKGSNGIQTFKTSFMPLLAMVDMEEKLGDATVDFYLTLKSKGINSFKSNLLYFKTNVTSINDSVFIRVTHNWVSPDNFKIPHKNLVLANNRYWKVEGIFPAGFVSKAYFWFDKSSSGHLDDGFFTGSTDSLVLMFRKDASCDWDSVKFNKSAGAHNVISGTVWVDTLKTGEYAFARRDSMTTGGIWGKTMPEDNGILKVFPNPSNDSFTIGYSIQKPGEIRITNTSGKVVLRNRVNNHSNNFIWRPSFKSKGIYFVELIEDNVIRATRKIIYN